VVHVLAVNPVPARSQMGSSLGFHIILACFGVAFAVATVVGGWGLAQYPYLVPTSLRLAAGSAPTGSLVGVFVVAGLALLLVAPAFALLYLLPPAAAAGADGSRYARRPAARRSARSSPSQPARGRPGAGRDPDHEGAGAGRAGRQGDQGCLLTLTPPVTAVPAPLPECRRALP
jgi:hypothetical protein